MPDNHDKRPYHTRTYNSHPRPSDPTRNLCADILLQAMEDVQTKQTLARYAGKTSAYGNDLLKQHQKAVYYFTHSKHAFLCLILDLDPEQVKKRALTGEVKYHYKTNDG